MLVLDKDTIKVIDRSDVQFVIEVSKDVWSQALDIRAILAAPILQTLDGLFTAMMIRTDPIFAFLHQRSRATGTRLGEFDGLELYLLGSIAERIDAGHLRNHLARLLHKDIRTDGQTEAADI